MRWQLSDGGELELWTLFIAPVEQSALYRALAGAMPWRQREIKMFGRAVLEPRVTAWIGDQNAVVITYAAVQRAMV